MAAAAHVFVDDLDEPRLGAADLHHLSRALRLRAGQPVTISDGEGGWRLCRWRGPTELAAAVPGPGGAGPYAALDLAGPVHRVSRPTPVVTVGFTLVKGERPESVARRLTEAGVDRLVPMTSARSVVRGDEGRSPHHLARLRRVVREAAAQCRRVWLPEVGPTTPMAELAASLVATGAGALAHPGGGPPSLGRPAVLIGPEGGWDEAELACGLPLVGLGENVLRSETAALAAGLLMGALRAGLVGEAVPDGGGRGTGVGRP